MGDVVSLTKRNRAAVQIGNEAATRVFVTQANTSRWIAHCDTCGPVPLHAATEEVTPALAARDAAERHIAERHSRGADLVQRP